MAIGAVGAQGGSRKLRVGLVLEQPLVSRGSDPFQYGAFQGLVRAEKRLHIQGKSVAPSPTGVGDQFVAPFSDLAREHYDLVIAVGYLEVGALSRTAYKFPHQKFAILDATRQDVALPPPHPKLPPPNLVGTHFHTEQAAYLAGFLAARMADRRPGRHVVSSVGGIKIPTVTAYIAGFEEGARHADPKIKLLRAYTNTFLTRAPCAHAARKQIEQGSEVVFNVAGACGLGALETAKRLGVYGIGVDIDQGYLGDFVLTSVLKNLNVGVYDLAKRLIHGRLRMGTNLSFTLRNKGVKLGRFSPLVPPGLRRQLVPLKRQIEDGTIVVPTTPSRAR